MKHMTGITLLIMVIAWLGTVGPASADAPVQVALINPIQLVHEIDDVKGFRFNAIYGINDNVSGVDFGLINRTVGEQKGFQLGIFNTTYQMSGLQFGLFNRTEWLDGIQIGLINVHENGDLRTLPLVNFSF